MPLEDGSAEQPVQGQVQATETSAEGQATEPAEAPATPAPESAQVGSGPWANDLAELFSDESVRAQVDGFLREKVQPYVTQIEQKVSELKPAEQLYTLFLEEPDETYLEVTRELFGDELAEVVQQKLDELYGEGAAEEQATQQPGETEPQHELPPEVAELVEERRQAKLQAAYNAELERIKASVANDPSIEVVDKWFHPFVVAADGDMDLALEGYREWYTDVKQRLGGDPTPPAEEQGQQPPPVLGSDVAPPAQPPAQKKYESLDEAVDDFLAEVKASAPPTVGSI